MYKVPYKGGYIYTFKPRFMSFNDSMYVYYQDKNLRIEEHTLCLDSIDMAYAKYAYDYVERAKERCLKDWFLATHPDILKEDYWNLIRESLLFSGFLPKVLEQLKKYYETKDDSVFDQDIRKFIIRQFTRS